MKRSTVMKRIYRSGLAMMVSLLSAQSMRAASGVWNGAGDAFWTNSANWSQSPYPGAATGEAAVFDGAGGGNTVLDLLGLASIRTIRFETAATAAYTLGAGGVNAQTLVFEGGSVLAVSNGVSASQTVNATLVLGVTRSAATYTFQNDGVGQTLTLAGDVTGSSSGGSAGTKTLNLSGYGSTILSGTLSNGGASSVPLNSYGTNTLSGNNTFSGSVTVYEGTLRLTHSNALGSGSKTASANNNVNNRNPSFLLDGSAGDLTIPTNITFQTSNSRAGAIINVAGDNTILGNIVLTSGDGATHLWSHDGKLTIAGNMSPNTSSRALHFRGEGDGEVSGSIANGSTAALPVYRDSGSGTWTLSGANTFSGALTVSAGALAIAGSNGTVNTCSALSVSGGAALLVTNSASANHTDRL